MLELTIPKQDYEFFDENTEEFVYVHVKETKIQIEHSLISLKKWEQKWHKPFLKEKEKTEEEMADYIRCMTLNHGVDPEVYKWIPEHIMKQIVDYIENPMTATWFNNSLIGAQKSSTEQVTAEIIYYWMVALNIPVEFQKWHLNSLLTLIKVVNIKSQPEKKMDKAAAAKQRAELNRKRRQIYGTKG